MSEVLQAEVPDRSPLTFGGPERLPLLRPPSTAGTQPEEPDRQTPETIVPHREPGVDKGRHRTTHFRESRLERLRLLARRPDLAVGSFAAVVSVLIGFAIATFLK